MSSSVGPKGLCAIVACCFALAVPALAGASNPAVAYQVDVAHSGVQVDDSLVPPLGRRWQATFEGAVSYPLIAGGLVYVTVESSSGHGTTLYALDRQGGSVVWSRPVSGTAWSNAAYDADRLFVADTNGYVQAVAADTGALGWARQLPDEYFASAPPTASDGVVYVGVSGTSSLYALDEATGTILARQRVQYGDKSSPTLSSSGVFVSYACNQAFGFSRPSLSLLWHYSGPCGGGGGKTAVYADGRLYTRDFFGNLILDTATGDLVRSYTPEHTQIPAPAVDSSAIYSLSWGELSAQTVSDGSVLWRFSGDGQLDTAPIVLSSSAGRLVVEGSASGMLYGLSASTGEVVWKTDVGAPPPSPDEQNVAEPLSGISAGEGLLLVPAGSTLSAYAADRTAPTLALPGTIVAAATSPSGANVTFSATATDPDDAATVSCSPSAGSTFPAGVTTVGCTATDTAGNAATGSFLVVVSAQGAECDLSRYPLAKGTLNLKGANLGGCYLPGANLAGANATNASLRGAYLAGANLGSANLTQAQLRGAVLANANLAGVKWLQTTCPDGTNSNADGGTCLGHLG
jgi:outer membrane protein assembly factor BamB